ncbi:unnamed protein product [Coregonus sp. 'balchen']|nr:unnamed protein product [Coregonus sp. 'balchen']
MVQRTETLKLFFTQACQVGGRRVTVVDTLGWDWRSVQDTSEWMKQEVVRSVQNLTPSSPWSRGALWWLVEKSGNRYHVMENENPVNSQQVAELLEKIEEMVVGYESELLLTMYQQAEESNQELKLLCEDNLRTMESMRESIKEREEKI